jgi:cytochrome c oxidase subunit 4
VEMQNASPEQPEGISLRTYAGTYVVLLVLATLSLLLSRVHFAGGLAAALAIAVIKAAAVLWFFMHLVEQSSSSRFAVLVAVSLMVVLAALTLADVATRHTFPPKAEPMPSSGFYQR